MNLKSRTLSFVFPLLAFAAVTFGGSVFAGTGLIGVTISSTETDPTNASPIPITFTFDEDVENFTSGDITPTNGALSNFQTVSADVYTVDITPSADGTVSVAIAEGAAQGLGGGDDSEADSFDIEYDGTAPTPTITTPTNPTNVNPIPVTVTFDEDVTGFDLTDVTVGNGTPQNLNPVSAQEYEFEIVPTAEGDVTVDVPAMGVQDDAGNDNIAAAQLVIGYDVTAPTPTITTPDNPATMNPIPVTVTFDEDVIDFVVGDIVITNGTPSNFMTVSASEYTLDITPTDPSMNVAVNIAAAVCTDDAGNDNNMATELVITPDNTPPTFTITIVQNGSQLAVTVEFNEDVTGFDATDVTVGNGTLSNFMAVSGTTYTFDVVSLTGSPVTIDIADMAAMDGAGNESVAGTNDFDLPSIPDLRMGKKGNPNSHKGDNNYRKVRHKEKDIPNSATFFISMQNDGVVTDSFTARSKKNKSFKVTYRAIGGGGNVTARMMARGYVLTLGPDEVKKVKATVRTSTSKTNFKDVIRLLSNRSSAKDKGIVTLKFRKSQAGNGIVPGTVGGSPLP